MSPVEPPNTNAATMLVKKKSILLRKPNILCKIGGPFRIASKFVLSLCAEDERD
jgi:hypothetical protein